MKQLIEIANYALSLVGIETNNMDVVDYDDAHIYVKCGKERYTIELKPEDEGAVEYLIYDNHYLLVGNFLLLGDSGKIPKNHMDRIAKAIN